jgi:O-antigen/teichoic acid export membrane protein
MATVLRSVPRQRRIHPLFRDFGLTLATNIICFFCGLAVITIFGRLLGAGLLAEYLLVRRVIGWLSASQLGLGVGLPRYVAHSFAEGEGKQETYFVAAAVCLAVFTAALLLPFNLAPATFSRLLFGDPGLKGLILPLSMFFLGLAVHCVVYSYYRGCLRMGVANAMSAWNQAAIPLMCVGLLFRTHSVGLIVSAIGVVMTLSSVLFAIPILRLVFRRGCFGIYRPALELLRYGAPRIPGDFSGGALFALGPVIASHYFPMQELSSLLLGISMMMALGVSTGPIGMILLSKISMMLAQNRQEEVRSQIGHLLAAVVELSAFITIQAAIFSGVLVRIWVGHTFSAHSLVIRLVILATPFYLTNMALRSAIDAGSVKAYDARNSVCSLIAFLALARLEAIVLPTRLMLEGIAAAFLLAMIVLAWLTERTVRQLYDVGVPWRRSAPSIAISLVLGGIVLLAHWSSGFRTGAVELIILEITVSLAFVGALILRESSWLQYLWHTALPRKELTAIAVSN